MRKLKLNSFSRLFQYKREITALVYFTILSFFVTRSLWIEQGVITFEDYVPFFSIRQLWNYVSHTEWNSYLNMPIFRDYSFFFIWARLSNLTVFSMTFLIILSGFLLFLSVWKMLRIIFGSENSLERYITLSSICSATFALCICLYAKLSHFYTLVVGMALFSFCLSSSIDSIMKSSNKWDFIVSVLFISLLLWITPSPHFIYLFYISISLFVFLFVFCTVERLKVLGFFIALIFLHFVPYSTLVAGVFSHENLSEIFPVTYSLIKGGSVSPLIFFSSFQTSVIELFIYDSYGPRVVIFPMVISIFISVLAISVTLVKKRSKITLFLCILYLTAFFFAVGTYLPFSGAEILLRLYEVDGLRRFVELILQVLRMPHRWQFLELYAKMNFMAAAFIIICKMLQEKMNKLKRLVFFKSQKNSLRSLRRYSITMTLFVLFLLPFFLPPYNIVFDGNFCGVTNPVSLDELSEIKQIITPEKSNLSHKLISFTGFSMILYKNSQKLMIHEGFYPFYLDCSSIKWQSSTTPENMFYGSFGYYLALGGKNISNYFALQNVKWILFRDSLKEFYTNESHRILSTLLSDEGLSLIYHKNDYYIFRNQRIFSHSLIKSKTLTLAIAPYWTPFRMLNEYNISPNETVFIDIANGDINFTTFEGYSKTLGKHLIIWYYPPMHNETDIVLSLLLKEKGIYCTPDKTLLLEKEGWLSNNQFNSWSKTYVSSIQGGIFGHYGATDKKYIIGTAENLSVNFRLNIQEEGQYSIFLKVTARNGAKLRLNMGNLSKILEIPKILGNYKFVEIYSGSLNPGYYDLTLQKLDKNPITLNLIYAIKKETLANATKKFENLTSTNRNKLIHSYQGLVEYCDTLDYPAKNDVLYYPNVTYSNSISLETGGLPTQPLEAWYCGTALIIPHTTTHPISIKHMKTHGYYPYGVLFVALYTISLSLIRIKKGKCFQK